MTFTTPLYDVTIPEGGDVTFKCVSSKPEKADWYKNGKKITKPSKRIQIRDDNNEHTLKIEKAELDDEAKYTAQIGTSNTTGNLTVEGSDTYGNTLRPKQNGCHFTDDIFKFSFLTETFVYFD